MPNSNVWAPFVATSSCPAAFWEIEEISPLMKELQENSGDYSTMITACRSLEPLTEEYPDEKFILWCEDFQTTCDVLDVEHLAEIAQTWPELMESLKSSA